jgi:hypothetical protein
MANREGGVAIRLALTGISRTVTIQYRIRDFAQTSIFQPNQQNRHYKRDGCANGYLGPRC